jgi:hypothetical protein
MLHSKPVFVVMYGINERPYWEKIAGSPLVRDGVVKAGPTMIAFAPHPQVLKITVGGMSLGRT